MKVSALTFSSIAILVISGCSFTPKEQATGSFDYVEVKTRHALQPAADLSLPPARNRYDVPVVSGSRDIGTDVNILAPVLVWPTAPGSRVEESDSQVRVHFDELEGMSNLPTLIWSVMTQRLQADGIAMRSAVTEQQLETDWITTSTVVGEDELELVTERRYAIEFESPAHRRTVAVAVTIVEKNERGAGAGMRPNLVDDRNQAALLLNRLINEVAMQYISQSQSIGPDVYTVSAGFDDNGFAALRVDTSFINTWTMVGLVLPELGFTIDDLNQTTGRYYVSYSSESSVLSQLAFWRDKPSLALPDGDYEVVVTGNQSNTSITFYRDDKALSAQQVNALYAPIAAEFRRQLEL